MFAADDMDKSERYRRSYMRTVTLQALLVTLAAHLLLLMLFRTAPQKNSNIQDGRSGIRLFNIGAKSPERRAEIVRWLTVHDPSVIARADSRYSAVRRLMPEKRRDVQDVTVAARNPVPPAGRSAAPAVMEVYSGAAVLPVVSGRNTPAEFGKGAIFPRIKVNAVTVSLPVSDEMIRLSREVNAGRTVIELCTGEQRDSFAVRRSSGSGRLDMQTVRMLLRNREMLGSGLQEVIVDWRREDGK